MKHAMKAPFQNLGAIVLLTGLSTGCASADPDFQGEEDIATSSEAVVSGWTAWSESTQSEAGIKVGCDNGSLVAGIRRQGSKTKIYCTPVAGSNNTGGTWTGWVYGPSPVAACRSDEWVTGYQSSSWDAGSGFRVRCSKTPGLFTGFCPAPYEAGNNTGDTWFGNGYYMKGGGCGTTCSLLKWTACIATPRL
jgi:hypothetical protein